MRCCRPRFELPEIGAAAPSITAQNVLSAAGAKWRVYGAKNSPSGRISRGTLQGALQLGNSNLVPVRSQGFSL
jgi:hypothetical protein